MILKNESKESIDLSKNELRSRHKKLRREIFSQEKNSLILQNLKLLDVYKKANNILAFYPLNYEIDLRKLFINNEDNKNWFLPKFVDDNLHIYPFTGEEKLVTGAFNIKEPISENELAPEKLDLIIMPALAVDKTGNRLGYGKGCYDKFLNSFDSSKIILILPIFDALIIENIPHTSLDRRVNIIVSETQTIVI